MSILQRIFGTPQTKAQVEAGEPLPNVTINYTRRMLTTNEQDIYTIYKASTLVQSCVNTWINEFTSAPFKAYVNDKPVESSTLDLFNVNIMQQLMFQMLLSGTAFIYKIRNSFGQVINVQILSGFHVMKQFDASGNFSNWIYQTAKGEFVIDKNDIVAITWFTKSTDDYDFGISPITSVIQQAEQLEELQRFITDLTANDFIPRTILSAPPNQNLTVAQQKLIIDQVREEFQKNPGSIKVLNGGWTISRLALGLDEMDTQSLRIVPEVDICGSFQIPPTVLHTVAGMQNSTYNNVESSRKFFIQNTVSGMWSRVEQIINEHFSFEFTSLPQWYFETADLTSMQEDTQAKYLRYQNMFQSNAISRSEFRAEMDLEDIDNGQQVFYQDLIAQSAFGAIGLAEAPTPEPLPVKQAVKKKVKQLTIPQNNVETKAEFWRRFNRITDNSQKQFEEILSLMLDDMKKRTYQSVKLGSDFLGDGNIKQEDLRIYNEEIISAQEKVRLRLANDLGFAPDDIGQIASNDLSKMMIDTSEELYKSLEKMIVTTEKKLKTSKFESLEDKLKLVDTQFDTFKNVNSKAITNYTANNITTSTQEIIFKDKGVKYIWLTQRDGVVRPAHRAADGQEPDTAGYFTVGGERTKRPCGSGMSAKNSVNCRCILYPVS